MNYNKLRVMATGWSDQYVQEQVAWQKAAHPNLTADQLGGYRAGLEAGYHAAIRDLKMHNLLTVKS